MYEFILKLGFVPQLLAALAPILLVAGFLFIKFGKRKIDDDWRDEPPLILKLARPIVNAYAPVVAKSMPPHKKNQLQDKLNAAGVAYVMRPEEFIVMQRLGAVFGFLFGLYLYSMLELTTRNGVLAILGLTVLGLIYPNIWIRDVTKKRQHLLEKQFPFMLDLLSLSMNAGLNFSSAVPMAVAKLPDGPVKIEFGRFIRETRTGMTRRESLERLGARVQIPAVANFVASVNQAEETGGALGDVLSSQAKQRRTERFLKAEKLANQAPVKMLAPLMGLLFPLTFIIIMFPIAMKFTNSGASAFFGN